MPFEVDAKLASYHSQGSEVIASLSQRLPVIINDVQNQSHSVASLELHLQGVADSARQLSSRVLLLERVIHNVARTARIAKTLAGLKENLKNADEAVKAADFEVATFLVSEFRELDKSGAAQLADESAVEAFRALERALVEAVRKKFESAVASGQSSQVARLAKLFSPLGLGSEAVSRFITFFRKLLADKCLPLIRAASHPFASATPTLADSATQIFLAVADIIQDHHKHIEEEFGPQSFLLFIQGISSEASLQAMQLFEMLQKQLGAASACDLRVLDTTLEQTATVFQRCNRFDAYIRQTVERSIASLPSIDAPSWSVEQVVKPNAVLVESVQEMSGTYIQLEEMFLSKSIQQAVREDLVDVSDPNEKVSTMVDDVFFICTKVIRRSAATLDAGTACAVVNNTVTALQTDFKAALETAANLSRKNFATFAATPKLVLAAVAAESPLLNLVPEVSSGKAKIKMSACDSYPHALSDVAQSLENLATLKRECLDAFDEFFPDQQSKRAMYSQSVGMLDSVRLEFEEMHHAGCRLGLHFFKAAFLTPSLVNLDRVSFELTEESFLDLQINDVFAKAFVSAATTSFQVIRKVFLRESVEIMIGLLADQLSARLEKLVLQQKPRLKFTLLGAVQLDQDVRYVSAFFTKISETPIRQKFARLVDICTVLNFENFDEFLGFYAPRGRPVQRMRLAPEEIKDVLLLRGDFPKELIDATFST